MERLKTQYQQSLQNGQALNEREYECPKCKDVGGLIVKKVDEEDCCTKGKEYEVWVDCDCQLQKRANNLLKVSEITDEFKNKTFSNYEITNRPVAKAMKDIATKYFQEYSDIKGTEQNSIALLGQPGCGKTHLLTALSNNMMQKKLESVLYFPYVEGFNDLRNDFEKLEAKLIRMKEVEILYIDDLFKPASKPDRDGKRIRVPQASEWELKQLFAVINYRQMNNKPIFISSELDFNEMIALDEGLGTRIYMMCKQYFMTVEKDLSLNYRLA